MTVPPGWYADPYRDGVGTRWWDGEKWTPRARDAAPPEQAAAAAMPALPESRTRPLRVRSQRTTASAPDRVWAVIADPTSVTSLQDGCSIGSVRPTPDGWDADVSVRRFGAKFSFTAIARWDPGRVLRIASRDVQLNWLAKALRGQLADCAEWTLVPTVHGTTVTLTMAWTNPSLAMRLVRPISRISAQRQTDRQLETLARSL